MLPRGWGVGGCLRKQVVFEQPLIRSQEEEGGKGVSVQGGERKEWVQKEEVGSVKCGLNRGEFL